MIFLCQNNYQLKNKRSSLNPNSRASLPSKRILRDFTCNWDENSGSWYMQVHILQLDATSWWHPLLGGKSDSTYLVDAFYVKKYHLQFYSNFFVRGFWAFNDFNAVFVSIVNQINVIICDCTGDGISWLWHGNWTKQWWYL